VPQQAWRLKAGCLPACLPARACIRTRHTGAPGSRHQSWESPNAGSFCHPQGRLDAGWPCTPVSATRRSAESAAPPVRAAAHNRRAVALANASVWHTQTEKQAVCASGNGLLLAQRSLKLWPVVLPLVPWRWEEGQSNTHVIYAHSSPALFC